MSLSGTLLRIRKLCAYRTRATRISRLSLLAWIVAFSSVVMVAKPLCGTLRDGLGRDENPFNGYAMGVTGWPHLVQMDDCSRWRVSPTPAKSTTRALGKRSPQ